uniref:DNA polymerase theta-like n=1 Tax=Styela clava TaxID=7725 RepID=UPI00193A9442|nr:DNA polymerase theta-like [Styela clava]
MESKLQLKNWGLPQCVLDQYNKNGLESMFQWQAECLSINGVLDGRNLVYAAPTSAGKTLVVEILLLKRILETGKKALFILPFVSVAREKLFHMRTLFEETGIRVDGYMGGHAPTNGFSSVDVAVCTIEKANGLINRLIEEKNIDQIGMLVIDELHMVGDEGRGYILELLLTKIRYERLKKSLTQSSNNTNIQIVGMSATLPNLSLLADWLDAALYVTDFRPVPLQRCLKIGSAIYDNKLNKIRDFVPAFNCKNDDDNLAALCYETLNEGNSVLVFCPTKNWCEKLANNVAHQFYDLNSSHQKDSSLPFVKLDLETLKEIFEQLSQSPVGVDAILNRTLPLGVAYHHAGLTTEERDIVEAGFRIGAIRVLIATSTLSSGVNLPARRVIIRTPTFNRKTLDVRTYLQMTGRAGRKGVDDQGESILICRQNEQTRGKSLLTSRPLPVKSCLIQADNEELTTSMKRAILEIIVNGVASSYESVMEYTDCTLLSAQLRTQEPKVIKGPMTRRRSSISSPSLKRYSGFNRDVIENCVEWLVEHEFVHFQDGASGSEMCESNVQRHIIATQLGRAALLSSLPTSEALTVLADLHQAMKALALDTELHLIYLVTPIFCYNEWTGLDWYQYLNVYESLSTSHKNAANLIGVTEQFLTRMASGAPTSTRRGKQAEKMQRLLGTHRRFYAALALHDLVQEVSLSNVCSKYSCNRGMLQQLQQSAASFAGMVTTFCQELGWWSLEVLLREFQTRLAFGVQRELMDLMQISLLNSQRARALYTAGLITCQQVSHAEPSHIELVLRNALHFQTNRKAVNESDWEVEERRKQRNVHVTGKRGITEYEAAQLIIDEAKKICGSKQIKDESFMAEKSPQTKKSKTQSSHKDKKLILLTEETPMNIGDNGTIDNVDKVTGNKTLDLDQLNGDSANVVSVKSTGKSPSNNRTEKVFTEVQTGEIESLRDDQPNINCFQNQLLSREAPILTKESMEKGLSNYEKVSKQLSPISTQHTREMFNKQTTNSQISDATLMPDPNDVSKSSSLVETHRPYKQGLPDFNSTSKTVSQVVDSGSKQGLPDSSYVVKESSITETHKSCKQMLPDSDYSSKTVSQVKTHPSSITSSKQGLQVFVSIAKESSITDTQLQLVLGDDTMNSSFSDSETVNDTNSAVKEKEDSSKINPNLVTDSVNQNSKMCLNIDIACQDAEKLNENTAKFITNQSKGEDDSISSANLSCSETNNSSILESEDIFAETKFDNSITVLDSVKTDNAVTIVEDSPASCKELELNIEDSMSSDWDQN